MPNSSKTPEDRPMVEGTPPQITDTPPQITDTSTTPEGTSTKVKLVDYLARTCGLCPSIAEVKAGTKTPKEHCKTCQSCRKNLKGYATLALYGGIQLLEEEITPSELLEPSSPSPSEIEGTTPQVVYVDRPTPFKGKGKTATVGRYLGETIENLYKQGKKPVEIAKITGKAISTIYKYLNDNKLR